MQDLEKLKALLEEQETFPLAYTHKFIGNNTPAFAAACASFEKKFTGAALQSRRESAAAAHVAMTYVYMAPTADAVIHLIQHTQAMPDVRVIL